MISVRVCRIVFHKTLVVSLILCVGLAPSGNASGESDNPPALRFEEISEQAGLTIHHISSLEKRYILDSMSGGVGLIDCDNNGRLDIVVANGSTVDRFRHGGDLMVTLYRQTGDLHFTNVTLSAGLTRRGWGMGVAIADFDNDGRQDIFVTGYNGNALYRNLGGCRFEDVTDRAGVRGGGFSTGAAWADYDRDGYVDLFVSRYVRQDIDHLPEPGSNERYCHYKHLPVQCGPIGLDGETDLLYHNHGDGTFEEVSKKAGVDGPDRRRGLGVIWGDYDNDGWPDLYVANDMGPNYLYHNRHDGTFEEVALISGVGLSKTGQPLGSMGVDFGDFDRDGKLDLLVTNFVEQPNNLYHNDGATGFDDVGWPSRFSEHSYFFVKWGCGFADFDNSGWLDIFVANGHVYPQADQAAHEAPYRQPLQLFRNLQGRSYEDASKEAGIATIPSASYRGVAFGDLNNDGNVDVVAVDIDGAPKLLINRSPITHHRVLFKLVGTKSNKMAVGTRVRVSAGQLSQVGEVRAGGSYLSQNDLRLHFGLADRSMMDEVEINWPSGKRELFRDLRADFIYTLVEGSGISNKAVLPPVRTSK